MSGSGNSNPFSETPVPFAFCPEPGPAALVVSINLLNYFPKPMLSPRDVFYFNLRRAPGTVYSDRRFEEFRAAMGLHGGKFFTYHIEGD